ncbi:hypothetical protein DXM21_23215 [Agrobacterium rosae]|nr:hypothetical protein DXM21_23215 [Agrobacterium rosae]KAA3513479.1 hypothetical protein DXM25_23410 [Agrobacterium rosae]MQB51035.1 hypothetical protein [Agrobacterium rosae]
MKRYKFIGVSCQRDADRLQALNINTLVDHAFWHVTHDRNLARRVVCHLDAIKYQFPDMKAAALPSRGGRKVDDRLA